MAVDPRYEVQGAGYASPLAPEASTSPPTRSPPPLGEGQGEGHADRQRPVPPEASGEFVAEASTTPSPSCPGGELAAPECSEPLAPEASTHPYQPAGGHHLLVDFWVEDTEPLRRVASWVALLPEACRAAGATVLGSRFHQFQPEGVTGIVLLAESHASLHTWPEAGLVTLDVFTCGALDAHAIVDRIREALSPVRERVTAVDRGDRATPTSSDARGPASGEPPTNDASGVPFP